MRAVGLKHIRLLLALTTLVCSIIGLAAVALLGEVLRFHDVDSPSVVAALAPLVVAPALFTYAAVRRMTRTLDQLNNGMQALAFGDASVLAQVDCRDEIGGLAENFRSVVARLNSNVVRMNLLSYSDPVTQLLNRTAFTRILRYALSEAEHARFDGAAIFIKLDNFRKVSDTLGHRAGDELLRMVAQRLLEHAFGKTLESLETCLTPLGEPALSVPHDVLFARFGDDEFVALVPGVVEETALNARAQSIVHALEEPFTVRGVDVKVSAGIGIARAPMDTTNADELITFADLATFAGRGGSAGRSAFFDMELHRQARDRLRLEGEVRAALERDDILVFYQPKLNLQTLAVAGVEALVRVRDGQGHILNPGEFIEIAERSDLIEQVGRVVLRKAARQCRDWLDSGLHLPVAVNASALQFTRLGFAVEVLAILESLQLPAEMLEIEVTESAAMVDLETTWECLKLLQRGGVRIAIDDFGTGFSNIAQLSRLPYDTLKIDRSMVEGIGEDQNAEAILSAVIAMAEALGHETVAEGVETSRQLAFLQARGCDLAQGFLFGRPMSAEALAQWLSARRKMPPLGAAVPAALRA